jgi:drug/metabolite transporter (DMT)-like permease
MLGAFVMYSGIDVLAKTMGQMGYQSVMITWGRTGMQVLMLLPFLVRAGGLGAFATRHPKMQLLRGGVMTFAGIFFVSGLAYLPLATMTAINFINPFMITILSIVVLKEAVGPHRWVAIGVGFLGALVIIRPGTESFHPAGLFAIGAAACWSISVIATRLVQDHDSGTVTMFYTAVIGVVLTSFMVPAFWKPLTWEALLILVGMGICSLIGQAFMIAALRHASPSLLAPLGYSQLLWAIILGFLLFGNFPDGWTLAGAGIIVLSGLYMWWREQKAAH